jgi:hypothetical protein
VTHRPAEDRAEDAKPDLPDPLLAANLYLGGRLDSLIQQVLSPFWREFSPQDSEGTFHLWFLRYARGGEHLKIRIHGPEPLCFAMKSSLEAKARLAFVAPGEPPGAASAKSRSLAPPIDPEDSEDHPDRVILWTMYRRSSVVLGVPPLIDDDRYVALFTRCLGRGCTIVLSIFESGDDSQPARQRALFSLLTSGVAAIWQTSDERTRYLVYHRNWLVRSLALTKNLGERRAREILDRYDAASRSESTLEELERSVCRQAGRARRAGGSDRLDLWMSSLLDLREYLQRFEGLPDYSVDPFADGPLFPSLFKLFHCMANQLCLNPLNEGLAHHLVLRALSHGGKEEFSLIPE